MVERPTREEIRALLGSTDDATLTSILELGASRAELIEARAWIENDEAMLNEGRASPSGRVARIVELLRDQIDAEELAAPAAR
jgi:hypothetical protein